MRPRIAALIAALILCAGLIGAAPALGASLSSADTGRAAAKKGGLTPRERKALKVVSTTANGIDGAGLVVTAAFKGNIEKAIGRGHLKRAVVALVLHPADATKPIIGVATRRGGAVGDTLSSIGTARVGVLRNGRELSFLIKDAGIKLSDYPGIEVKSFARFPIKRSRHRASTSATASYWEAIDNQISDDEWRVPTPDLVERCRGAQHSLEDLDKLLKRAKEREALLDQARREFEQAIPKLEDTLRLGQYARAGSIVLALASGSLAPFSVLMSATPGAPFGAATLLIYGQALTASVDLREKNQALRDAIRGLKLDVRLADAYIAKNRALIEKISEVKGQISAMVKTLCVPPVLTPIHAVFDAATRTTVYTENATGQDLRYRWTVSIPLDLPCANGFKPGFPAPNQASWNHTDTGEGGTCSHTAFDEGGSGHPGTVYVTVENNSWHCVATFTGTQGAKAEAVSDGPAPKPCELI